MGINISYIKNNIINEQTFQIYYEKFYHQKNFVIDDILSILNEEFNEIFLFLKMQN